ncbi:MAG TPA: GAP family protein [Mycobacterium sp.]
MPGNLASELAILIPLALIIATSPFSVVPAILVLHTARPRSTGLAYLFGWITGLAVITGASVGLSEGVEDIGDPPNWASWLRVAIGSALIIWSAYSWLSRHRRTHEPAWIRHITAFTPARAAVFAALLPALVLKQLSVCVAAGLSLGSANLGFIGAVIGFAVFLGLAASTVAIPVVGYLIWPSRFGPLLGTLKAWLQRHATAIVAVVLTIIGVVLLREGVSQLLSTRTSTRASVVCFRSQPPGLRGYQLPVEQASAGALRQAAATCPAG